MQPQWNSTDGFEILRKNFDEAIIFTAFTKNKISADDTINLLLNIIIKTGVFQIQYKE